MLKNFILASIFLVTISINVGLVPVSGAEPNAPYWVTVWLDNEPVVSKQVEGFMECARTRLDLMHNYSMNPEEFGVELSITCTPFDPLSVERI